MDDFEDDLDALLEMERELEPVAKRNLDKELKKTFDTPMAKAKLAYEKEANKKRPRTSLENLLEETNQKAKQKALQANQPFRLGQLDEYGRPKQIAAPLQSPAKKNNSHLTNAARFTSKKLTSGKPSDSSSANDVAYYSRLLDEMDSDTGLTSATATRANVGKESESMDEDFATSLGLGADECNSNEEMAQGREGEADPLATKRGRFSVPAQYDAKAGRHYSKTPFDEDCLYITFSDGERVYVEMEPIAETESDSSMDSIFSRRRMNNIRSDESQPLLSMTMKELKEEVDRLEELQYFLKQHEDVNDEKPTSSTDGNEMDIEKPEELLWVDKYSPKNFLELLSDDKINRSILSWLKEWDPFVFKRDFTPTVSPASNWKIGKRADANKAPNKDTATSPSGLVKKKSQFGKPEKQILLLHGNPGVGKSTVAHIIAKHAGYEPIEINASDDRSKKKFLPRVLDVLEIQSMSFGQKITAKTPLSPSKLPGNAPAPVTGPAEMAANATVAKPKCLIIDEIDGILGSEGQGAIEALVSLLKPQKSKAGKAKGKRAKKGGEDGVEMEVDATEKAEKKKAGSRINRPIICICNNLNVPALRPLREVSLVYKINEPLPRQLLLRLQYIAKTENVRIDSRTLQGLCDMGGHDIRSCINTFQFLSRKHKYISPELVAKALCGQKDANSDIFALWQQIFTKKTKSSMLQSLINEVAREEAKLSALKRKSSAPKPKIPSDLDNLYDACQQYGDYEKVVEGIFHNYLSVNYTDSLLSKTQATLSWLEFYSSTLTESWNQFQLQKFIPCLSMAVHYYCNVSFLPQNNLQYPKLTAYHFEEVNNRNILTSYQQQLGAAQPSHQLMDVSDLATDFLPFLLKILNLSHWEQQGRYTEGERIKLLGHLYGSYGLSFKDEQRDMLHSEYEDPVYSLDPPIDKVLQLSNFPTVFPAPNVFTVYYKINNRIQELKKELKRAEKGGTDEPTQAKAPSLPNTPQKPKTPVTRAPLPSTKGPVKEEVVRDFFGRIVTAPQPKPKAVEKKSAQAISATGASDTSGATTMKTEKSNIIYKFQDGSTNSVKRKVFIKDFL